MFYNRFEDPDNPKQQMAKTPQQADENLADNADWQEATPLSSKLATVFHVVAAFSLIATLLGYFQKDTLPAPDFYSADILQEPLQTPTERAPFFVDAGGERYHIKPLFDYVLHGMVVSYHHSDDFTDLAHERWADYLNPKDICVIWGDNVVSGIYDKMQFKNGSWTCYYKTDDRATWSQFRHDKLSNNHLLTDNAAISQALRGAKTGDQIYLKGVLASYKNTRLNSERGSSISRTDTGNGACETIYLDEFQVVKSANGVWQWSYNVGRIILVLSLLGAFIMAWFTPVKV